jgi:hypothetical protein
MNHTKLHWLAAMVVMIFTIGCSTIEPTPEAEAKANTTAWGAPPPAPADEFEGASLLVNLLGWLVR